MEVNSVDICCGLAWGDEAKGKITSHLASSGRYNFVCRYAGGANAGHTIYVNGNKYKTHLIPAGVFYNIPSIIGPGCVVNKEDFTSEINYLKEHNFNTNLIKVSPKAHVISNEHKNEDKKTHAKTQGSTSKGIAQCYRDKYGRIGKRVNHPDNIEFFKDYIWDEHLYGNILCEGAQGFWLDIDQGNYPYVTSSTTLPYGACSLGFSPKLINNIYGAVKIYDTRSGIDTDFPDSLLDDPELLLLSNEGQEYGVTTGRKRKSNWLNIDKLVKAINISGTTDLIISKIDILIKINKFKLFKNNDMIIFSSFDKMKIYIESVLKISCPQLKNIFYSSNPEYVEELY